MRNPLRTVVTVAAALVLGTAGLLVAAAPAHADEPGLWCTVTSRANIFHSASTPPPVEYGELITIHWTTTIGACVGPVVSIVGPGFTGGSVPLNGSRQVRVLTSGTTATWTLFIYDLYTDNPTPTPLYSRTLNVL